MTDDSARKKAARTARRGDRWLVALEPTTDAAALEQNNLTEVTVLGISRTWEARLGGSRERIYFDLLRVIVSGEDEPRLVAGERFVRCVYRHYEGSLPCLS